MPIDLTLVFEMNGMEGVCQHLKETRTPPDQEVEIDGEVKTSGELMAEYERHRDEGIGY